MTGTRQGNAGSSTGAGGPAGGNRRGGNGLMGGTSPPTAGLGGWWYWTVVGRPVAGVLAIGESSDCLSMVDRPGFRKGNTDSLKTALSEMNSFCASGSQKRQPL